MMNQDWINTAYAIIGLLGLIAGGLDSTSEKEAKQALAQKLNERFLRTHDSEPPISVFQAVFDALDTLLNRIFGSHVVSRRFILSTIIGSTLCFWAYLLLIILTGIQNVSIIWGIFESYRSILTLFILSGFSLITNILTIAQTQLFLRFFRANPTGLSFLVLAYSDLVLKVTLYIIIFSLGIAFSIVAMDMTMEKAIPAAVFWRTDYSPPSPPQRRERHEGLREAFCVELFEVNEPKYNDYQRPILVDMTGTWHTHCKTATDTHSEDEFIQKHFAGLSVIEFQKLSEVHHWPIGCGEGSNRECEIDYNYMVYVHPLLSIYDFPTIWGISTGIAGSSMISVVVPKVVLFIDLDQIYSFVMCPLFFFKEDICSLVRSLVTQTNPKIKALVPLTPFFFSTLFLSLAIYLSAFALKFLTILGEVLRNFFKTRGLRVVSERLPYTQGALMVLIPLVILIRVVDQILK